MNGAGRFHGALPLQDGPGADLVTAHGEEADVTHGFVGESGQAVPGRFNDAHVLHEKARLLLVAKP